MLDISATTAPKSDQQNYDDYLAGPKTVTISEVRAGTTEQPVDVHLVEFPDRPYKPSKSMRRVLVAAWGSDASTYAGRRMTLYGDPTVKFGGAVTGGIKISHLSHIAKPLTLSLTATKGKRAPHSVQPLPDTPVAITQAQTRELVALLGTIGLSEKEAALEFLTERTGRPITSSKELTRDEAAAVIDGIKTPADTAPGEHIDVATGEIHDAVVEDPGAEPLWPDVAKVPGA